MEMEDRGITIAGIRSDWVDFTCWNCCKSFSLDVDDRVKCPYCKGERKKI